MGETTPTTASSSSAVATSSNLNAAQIKAHGDAQAQLLSLKFVGTSTILVLLLGAVGYGLDKENGLRLWAILGPTFGSLATVLAGAVRHKGS